MAGIRIGRALKHRNFRLFFFGQWLSYVGTWIARFTVAYATYEISGSVFQLGLVAFVSQIPTILMPIAGVLVDRWDRHRTIAATQILLAIQSTILAALAFSEFLSVPHLLVLGFLQGCVNAVEMPTRQAFLRQLIDDRADLPNAIALNSASINAARLIGPVVAASVVALAGVGWCFAIDAMSYGIILIMFLMMRITKQPPPAKKKTIREEFVDGLRYVYSIPLIYRLMMLLAFTSILGGAYTALLPAITKALNGDVYDQGWLMGISGAGSLTGLLYLAHRSSTVGLMQLIRNQTISMGVCLIALELIPSTTIALPIFFAIGLSMSIQWTGIATLVQTSVDDTKLGRVMSLCSMIFFGGAPIGALLQGTLSNHIGSIHTLMIAGIGCLLGALVFTRSTIPIPKVKA